MRMRALEDRLLALDELQPWARLLRSGRAILPDLQLDHDAQIADRDQVAVPERRGEHRLSVQVERRRGGGAEHGAERAGLDHRVRRRDRRRFEEQVRTGAAQPNPLGAERARGLQLATVVHLEDDRDHRVSGSAQRPESGAASARSTKDRRTRRRVGSETLRGAWTSSPSGRVMPPRMSSSPKWRMVRRCRWPDGWAAACPAAAAAAETSAAAAAPSIQVLSMSPPSSTYWLC